MIDVPRQVAALFFARSGGRPLSLKLAMNLVSNLQLHHCWHDMFCNLQALRIREFALVIPRALSSHLLSSHDFDSAWIANTCMPSLEKLSIVALHHPDSLGRNADICLPSILSNTLPSLRSLTLVGVWLPSTWGGYKGLTKLHVRLRGMLILYPDILGVLRGSPNLEHIFISIPFASQAHDSLKQTEGSIRLPRIKHVELELVQRDMLFILSAISFLDSLAFLRLQCKSRHLDSIQTFLPADPRHLLDLNALTAFTVDLSNNQLRICPGPEAVSTQETRTFILESIGEPSLGSILSVASKAHELSTLRDEPFYAVYVRGCGSSSLDIECMTAILKRVPFKHTLGFSSCASEVVDGLREALGDLVLGKLEFYQMEISSEALLCLVLSHKTQIQHLSLLQCVLLAPSAEDARIVLKLLNKLLPGAAWYDVISYRNPDMDNSARLPL
ncbi:hypothetical protein EIP86_005335 [Pleurotus ostreatoroseus]|nr:hypothetical protein EIP86_005335 [Pleurotus ostreatoroseus]